MILKINVEKACDHCETINNCIISSWKVISNKDGWQIMECQKCKEICAIDIGEL